MSSVFITYLLNDEREREREIIGLLHLSLFNLNFLKHVVDFL